MRRFRQSVAALLAASCLAAPLPVCAGQVSLADFAAPVTEKPAAPFVPVTATGPDEVDLAALYYYADQGQEERVQAELARLQLKFPGFEPPKNLYMPAARRSMDEQPLWALYEKNDFSSIEAEIARLQAANPGWSPSEDFSGKLARRKIRVQMTAAVAARDWAGVIAAGEAIDPAGETEIDLLWMLVDAYHETGMREQIAEVCKAILFRQGEARFPDDLLAVTLQKAAPDFSAEEIDAVIKALWPQPARVAALAPVTDALLRRRVADFTANDALTAPLPEADLQRLAAQSDTAGDDILLGWYFLKVKQLPSAEQAFGKAMERAPGAEAAKGLYLSLSRQGRDADAYRWAAGHLDLFAGEPELLMAALAPRLSKPELGALEPQAIAAYSAAIGETQSADHAEILGWYAYNSKQFAAAEAWFAKAFEWQEKPERLKGLALSYLRENRKKDFAALRSRYGERYPDLWAEIASAPPPRGLSGATVGKPAAGDASGYAAALRDKRYDACIRELQRQEDRGGLSAEASLVRGWCFMGLNRSSDARAAFNAALAGRGVTRQDAAYGLALAALRDKLTDQAEAALSATPLSAVRDREIRAEIYWQRARAAFDIGQYDQALAALNARMQLVPEPTDMSKLRAWAHQKLGHKAEAKAIFERLSMHLSDRAVAQGLTAVEQSQR
ncbi:MAG: hypothetical protein BGO05_15175 [Rhizobiales bacterium 63-7]|nr:tetratricopeptide repeat protein [Hyphomicrobiales bacterium]OJU69122.1 MAG: hypothetical protein BGO05_15175 [Rhizobiales bacterium 63-7]